MKRQNDGLTVLKKLVIPKNIFGNATCHGEHLNYSVQPRNVSVLIPRRKGDDVLLMRNNKRNFYNNHNSERERKKERSI